MFLAASGSRRACTAITLFAFAVPLLLRSVFAFAPPPPVLPQIATDPPQQCRLRFSCARPHFTAVLVLAGTKVDEDVACSSQKTSNDQNIAAGKGTTKTENLSSSPSSETFLFDLPRESVANPLFLLLTAQFMLFIGVGAIIPSLPLYSKAIGLSSAANGIVLSAPAVALLIGAGPAGRFADRARKPAMIGGMALIAASDAGTALAPSILPLLVARLGLGAGRCVSESGERGMLADLAGRAPEQRGKVLGSQQAVTALGIAVGAPLGGIVVEQFGPRASFLCVTVAALIAMVVYNFLPETLKGPGGSHKTAEMLDADLSATGLTNPDSDDVNFVQQWSQLLDDNRWKGIALFECGSRFGFAAKLASIPVLASDVLPGGAAGAGALLSAAGLTGLLGAPLGGWLTDRAGAQTTAVASGIVSSTALFLIPFALLGSVNAEFLQGIWGLEDNGAAAYFAALVLLWGLGASAQAPAVTALSQQLAPPGEEATALSLPRAAGDATFIVAPFVLGLVADLASKGSVPIGAECAVAGTMSFLGVVALASFGSADKT